MRIIEDIVRVKKEGKNDLSRGFGVVEKTVAPAHSKKKIVASKKKAPAKSIKRKTKKAKKIKKTKKTIKLENLVSTDGKLILWMLAILFFFIFFIGIFLYDNKKDVPASIENVITELEKEDELLEKEISELEEFYTGELLEDTIRRIEEMRG